MNPTQNKRICGVDGYVCGLCQRLTAARARDEDELRDFDPTKELGGVCQGRADYLMECSAQLAAPLKLARLRGI